MISILVLKFSRRIDEPVLQNHVEIRLYVLRMHHIYHLLTFAPYHVTKLCKWPCGLKKSRISYCKPINVESMKARIKTRFQIWVKK